MSQIIFAAVAILTAAIVLLGYFIEIPVLVELRAMLVHWAIILAGVAVFVGVANLLAVHWNKIRKKQKGGVYGLLLIASLLLTFLLGLVLGPDHTTVRLLFEMVVIPVEASLMALLAVTLVYASIRLLRRRTDLMTLIFLVTAVLMLLGMTPLPLLGDIPILSDVVRPIITQVFATAGARGILLGMALGTLTTGLRILLGVDRPYGGK